MFGYQPDHELRIKQVGAAIIGGAAIGGIASMSAASTQASSQQAAINQQQQALTSQQNLEQPFITAGTQALTAMQQGLQPGGAYNTPFTAANFQNTPAYQFQMQQGMQGVNQTAAASGLTGSGSQLQALSTFNQGLAAQTYQQQYSNYMNNQQQQFANTAGIEQQGQAAAAGQAANIGQAASNTGNITVAQGATNAAGQLGLGQAVGSGLNSYAQNQYTQQLQQQQLAQQGQILNAAFNPNGTQLSQDQSLIQQGLAPGVNYGAT